MPKQTVNGVGAYYGPRTRFEGEQGKYKTEGTGEELVLYFSGSTYSLLTFSLPAGTVVVGNAVVEVTEAAALGGTTPVINIGVSGSSGTNRFAQISEAQAEATGTYSIASAGTLAVNTPTVGAQTIVVELAGTTPTWTGGKFKVVVPIRQV